MAGGGIGRRRFLGWSAGGALALAMPGCKKSGKGRADSAGGGTREVAIG